MGDEYWQPLNTVAATAPREIALEQRRLLARLAFDGACLTRATSRSLRMTVEQETHGVTKSLTHHDVERDCILPAGYWSEKALGNLHGDWWSSGNAQLQVGVWQVGIWGIEVDFAAAGRLGLSVLEASDIKMPGRRGRTPGTGYRAKDRKLAEKMHTLIQQGVATSRTDAARRVELEAEGAPSNRMARLVDAYTELYGIN